MTRKCGICGRQFARSARAARVSCTLVRSRGGYRFAVFHASCFVRSPAKAAAVVLGVGRKVKKEAAP